MVDEQHRVTLGGEPSGNLTPRELEVLRLVARGKSSKLVAYELGMSFRTVTSHRYRIYKKLGVTNTAELLIRAAQMGLVDLQSSANEIPQTASPLAQRIFALQRAIDAEREKLAAAVAKSKLLREAAAIAREEVRAAREELAVTIERLIDSSRSYRLTGIWPAPIPTFGRMDDPARSALEDQFQSHSFASVA